jgi:hypothetical protein
MTHARVLNLKKEKEKEKEKEIHISTSLQFFSLQNHSKSKPAFFYLFLFPNRTSISPHFPSSHLPIPKFFPPTSSLLLSHGCFDFD